MLEVIPCACGTGTNPDTITVVDQRGSCYICSSTQSHAREGKRMPNGGPDNCSTCGFNRRNGGVWRNPAPDEKQMPFCQIRGVTILNDHWTYCENWHTRTPAPLGPIYASGIYDEHYRRIPWHGAIAPEFVNAGVCSECRAAVHDGIAVPSVEAAPLVFCCNLHYLDWWKRQHPSEDAPMSCDIRERET